MPADHHYADAVWVHQVLWETWGDVLSLLGSDWWTRGVRGGWRCRVQHHPWTKRRAAECCWVRLQPLVLGNMFMYYNILFFWQICSTYHNMLCQHTVSTLIKMIVVVTNNNYNNSKSNWLSILFDKVVEQGGHIFCKRSAFPKYKLCTRSFPNKYCSWSWTVDLSHISHIANAFFL